MITENRHARAHIDIPLLMMVFAMAVFGVYCVCIATFTTSSDIDAPLLNHIVESSYTMRQIFFLLIAPLVVGVLTVIPYDLLRRSAGFIYLLTLVLLVFVTVTNGAQGVKAWLDIIWGYTIQPSEFAKLSTILILAREFAKERVPMNNTKNFFRIAFLVGAPGLVILMEGETGSLLVICFITYTMMFFGGVSRKTMFLLTLAVIVLLAGLYGFLVASGSDDYRLARIAAFINPEMYSSSDAYQMRQSQMVIGSGGLTGKGTFVQGAMSQLNYVPADWTDFIYATIGESFGFVGCLSVLVMYMLIILRMVWLAWYTRDKFGRMIIAGVIGMLTFHVLENIAMTLGLMPITGIPLPFLSYGGSNMVTNMGGVGLVLNATRNRSSAHLINTPQTYYNPYYKGRIRRLNPVDWGGRSK